MTASAGDDRMPDRLTIGTFARAAGLSAKALRLYAELELLVPASVDPVTGYRFYTAGQLERARLVAWLRRLGMPLAQIRLVCDLEPGLASREIAGFWARVEADVAERRELARTLVEELARQGAAGSGVVNLVVDGRVSSSVRGFFVDHAARTDVGLVRESNQDAAWSGERLLVVADGFGTRGAPASAGAVRALRLLESGPPPGAGVQPADLINAMQDALLDAVHEVNAGIGRLPRGGHDVPAGTTLTALLWTGSGLALAHIGDSRAYVLRDGVLSQITHDHSVVQFMVDSGRLSPEEARSHPQRSLLTRALDGSADPRVDISLHQVRAGERYLLCSDGLTSVVSPGRVRDVLLRTTDAATAATALIDTAHEAGAPDNVSCVVADIHESLR
ncbi:MerR family transcriptional regulator [Kineosporia sp. J2-2]|uniref:MerR family transcriptional regulator n=1 Tax=Kineosporia corallincola TaxID=2835133 RepID=A0ABS5TQ40_9ACTN|nr:MerR family transcriptional regulator [Kineosporia corallincola]MBT0773221.1 MerR family transcriptional regulator [Kineosporia corallincola]